jgi:hypothetical protein
LGSLHVLPADAVFCFGLLAVSYIRCPFRIVTRLPHCWRQKCSRLVSRATERGLGPRSKGGPAKNLNTKSERLTLICRVTWAWV